MIHVILLLPNTPGCVQDHLLPAVLSILSHLDDFDAPFPPLSKSSLTFLLSLHVPHAHLCILASDHTTRQCLKWGLVKEYWEGNRVGLKPGV